jgi:glycosyltransferase involved in cell wall biosynthesis
VKVLQLSYFGKIGGAGGAISMRRLHNGLRKYGIDSKVLCIEGGGSDNDFIRLDVSRYKKKINNYLRRASLRLGITGLDGVRSSMIKHENVYINSDIINIHRFFGLTSYLGLPSLTKDKPAVLTLCDTWAITGRCYYNLDCERWQYGCGVCPHMDVPPITGVDGSRFEWILKQWSYNHSNMTVVSKCTWMTEMLKQSMLKHFPIYQIPNGIDVEVYKPLDKRTCRSVLQIPTRRNVLMFSAFDLNNYIKGGDLLLQALDYLPASLKSQIIILVMGRNTDKFTNISGIETINLGYVESDADKALAYSAADLFLCPSRAEVFGNVNIESMSCGTPVVAFNIGGIPDFVRPNETGYLADPLDAKDFSRGIVELIEDESLRIGMSDRCRKVITSEFSMELQVDRYLRLYKQLLNPNLSQEEV